MVLEFGSCTNHNLSVDDFVPLRTVRFLYVNWKDVSLKVATHPALHISLTLRREVCKIVSGKMYAGIGVGRLGK